jgi:hypothetical protein
MARRYDTQRWSKQHYQQTLPNLYAEGGRIHNRPSARSYDMPISGPYSGRPGVIISGAPFGRSPADIQGRADAAKRLKDKRSADAGDEDLLGIGADRGLPVGRKNTYYARPINRKLFRRVGQPVVKARQFRLHRT